MFTVVVIIIIVFRIVSIGDFRWSFFEIFKLNNVAAEEGPNAISIVMMVVTMVIRTRRRRMESTTRRGRRRTSSASSEIVIATTIAIAEGKSRHDEKRRGRRSGLNQPRGLLVEPVVAAGIVDEFGCSIRERGGDDGFLREGLESAKIDGRVARDEGEVELVGGDVDAAGPFGAFVALDAEDRAAIRAKISAEHGCPLLRCLFFAQHVDVHQADAKLLGALSELEVAHRERERHRITDDDAGDGREGLEDFDVDLAEIRILLVEDLHDGDELALDDHGHRKHVARDVIDLAVDARIERGMRIGVVDNERLLLRRAPSDDALPELDGDGFSVDDSAKGLAALVCDEDGAALSVDEKLDDAGEVFGDEQGVARPVEHDAHGVGDGEEEVAVVLFAQVVGLAELVERGRREDGGGRRAAAEFPRETCADFCW